jgi:[ribosomal protein S5]-alanine N-acetyltransferase
MNQVPGKAGPRIVLETSRLILREMMPDDAEFMFGLLNQPSFLRFVGDKGIRTVADAAAYIEEGPRASYRRHGYGLNIVLLRETGAAMGICGLVTRDWLDAPDIGFSLLPAYWSLGYAFEAASAVLDQAESVHRLPRFLAITNPDNHGSIRLLERLAFAFDGMVRTPDGEELSLYARERATRQRPATSEW